jgi:hypothetical protein
VPQFPLRLFEQELIAEITRLATVLAVDVAVVAADNISTPFTFMLDTDVELEPLIEIVAFEGDGVRT